MLKRRGFFTFKMGHGLFYKECRTFTHAYLKNGKPVESVGQEYSRKRVSKSTLERFRMFGIMSDIESGTVRAATISPLQGRREAYEADYTMTDGSTRTVVYYFDDVYGMCRTVRTVRKASSDKVPMHKRNWSMPKFNPEHAGERYNTTLKERVARAVERALGRNMFRNS